MSTDNVVPFHRGQTEEQNQMAAIALRLQALAWTGQAVTTSPRQVLRLAAIADLAAAIAIDIERGGAA